MENLKQKSTRGGKREGAGRKGAGVPVEMISFRIEKQLLEQLKKVPLGGKYNRSRYLNDCVREKLKKDGYL